MRLPDIASGEEKVEAVPGGALFLLSDSIDMDPEPVNKSAPQLTAQIKKEYLEFLQAIRDNDRKPVFVFKKDFLFEVGEISINNR